jgi:F-type H+/Na+-transporting ATPase subunit alpha
VQEKQAPSNSFYAEQWLVKTPTTAIVFREDQPGDKDIPVKRVKEFEDHFLMEMENKLPDVMAEFKKGNLPEDGLKKMVELANGLIPSYKS